MLPSAKLLSKINKLEKAKLDSGVPFVRLDCRDRSQGWTYVIRFTSPGGNSTLTTLDTQDLERALAFRSQLQEQVSILNKMVQEARVVTANLSHTNLFNTITRYLNLRKARFSERTHEVDIVSLDLLKGVAGITKEIQVRELTPTIGEAWLDIATNRWSNPRTVNLYLRHLKSFGTYLFENEMLTRSPFRHLKKLREPDLPPKVLSKQQIQALFDSCEGDPYDWNLACRALWHWLQDF